MFKKYGFLWLPILAGAFVGAMLGLFAVSAHAQSLGGPGVTVIGGSGGSAPGGTVGQVQINNGVGFGGITVPPTDFAAIDPGAGHSFEWKGALLDQTGIWSTANAIQAAIIPSGGTAPITDQVSVISDNTGTNQNGCGGSSAGTLALCALPAPVNGEGMYAWICATNGTPVNVVWGTLPTGWSNVVFTTNGGNTTNMCGLFYKTATASEPATYTFTETPNGTMTGGIFEVAGANPPSTPPTSNQINAGNPSAPSITTASANNLIVTCAGSETNRSGFTVPPGFNLIVDTSASLSKLLTNVQGGQSSRAFFNNGREYGAAAPLICASLVQAAAGATPIANYASGQIVFAYANGPGEIDDYHIIRLGTAASTSIVNNQLTVWRDGESVPSINTQLQDRIARRGITTTNRYHSRYKNMGAAVSGGGGESGQEYLTMPFTKSIVMQVTNPDTAAHQISLWSDIYYHTNTITATRWGNYAHFTNVNNASYSTSGSPDLVNAFTEDTLANVAGTGALWDVMLTVMGGDNNNQSFEEGRLRIYLNGESTASWDSSGTEDVFQSSFNWSGETIPFATDFYGTSFINGTGGTADNQFCTASGVPQACCSGAGAGTCTTGAFSAFRIFGNKEPITFTNGVKVTWTCGNAGPGGVTNHCAVWSNVGVYLNQ